MFRRRTNPSIRAISHLSVSDRDQEQYLRLLMSASRNEAHMDVPRAHESVMHLMEAHWNLA